MNDMKYLISVVVITHNQTNLLSKAIDSVINQSINKKYEIIVISDDNSLNSTEKILVEYKNKYPNFFYKNVINKSALLSRIDGINIAKGDYICFLDGDDYYHKDMLKIMSDTMQKYNADLVNCYPYMVKKDKIKKYFFRKKMILNNYQAQRENFFDIFFRCFMVTKMFDRKLLKEVSDNLYINRDLPNFAYEDVLLMYLYLKKCKKVINIKNLLYYYNKNNTTSATNKIKIYQDYINVNAFIMNDILKSNDLKLLKLFNKFYFRRKLLLKYDLHRYNLLDRKIVKKVAYKEFKEIFKKKEFNKNNSYAEFLKNVYTKN